MHAKTLQDRTLRANMAAETGGSSSPISAVGDDLTALRREIANLGADVKRVATYGPELAHESYAAAVRRNPVQSTVIAAAVGFVLCLILAR